MDKQLIPNAFLPEKEGEDISEMEVLQYLTVKINQMLDENTDLLFSTLYRLDVDEQKIKLVLQKSQGSAIGAGLARLVLDRQKQREATKRKYR